MKLDRPGRAMNQPTKLVLLTIKKALQVRRQALRKKRNRMTSAAFEALRHEEINATFAAEDWLEFWR